jgi:hypothetical protein
MPWPDAPSAPEPINSACAAGANRDYAHNLSGCIESFSYRKRKSRIADYATCRHQQLSRHYQRQQPRLFGQDWLRSGDGRGIAGDEQPAATLVAQS